MAVGTGIESIRRRQERERMNNAGRPKANPNQRSATTQTESLNIEVSGVVYDVFVPGLHSPDDTSRVRYIP